MTFVDLVANVPRIALEPLRWHEGSSISPAVGAVGAAEAGVVHLRQASGPCCVAGSFHLNLDGSTEAVIDLGDDGAVSASHMAEKLEGLVEQG